MKQQKYRKYSTNQEGIVAIISVGLIVILVSLVTLGFARIMSREFRQAVDRELGLRAYYAAESGINDGQRYIASNPAVTQVSTCATIPVQQLDVDTAPTCILVNAGPQALDYQNIAKDNTQVVLLSKGSSPANPNIGNLYISWEANLATLNTFRAATTFPAQTAWGSSPPVLRVTVYPMQGGGNGSRNTAMQNARTFFLYPSTGPAAPIYTDQNIGPANPKTSIDGSIIGGRCATGTRTLTIGGVTNEVLQCNARISGLNNEDQFYIRITPLYQSARVKLMASNQANNALVRLYGAQTNIDVTAKANDQLKRLRAVVTSRPVQPSAFGGVESASEVCKLIRLQVNSPAPNQAIVDPTHSTDPDCSINSL